MNVKDVADWYAGKKVIVPTGKIARIDYELRTVHVDWTKQAFTEASPHSTPVLGDDESSLAEESSAILDYRIGIIRKTIQKAPNIPDDTKAELMSLVAGLESELVILSKTHHEEASSTLALRTHPRTRSHVRKGTRN